jgi:hypothetical protein
MGVGIAQTVKRGGQRSSVAAASSAAEAGGLAPEPSFAPVYASVAAASPGAIAFGFHLAVVNGPLDAIAADLGFAGNPALQGLVSSCAMPLLDVAMPVQLGAVPLPSPDDSTRLCCQSPPTQSLPSPMHLDAPCARCQAAAMPHHTHQPTCTTAQQRRPATRRRHASRRLAGDRVPHGHLTPPLPRIHASSAQVGSQLVLTDWLE